jgi:hypothetical protein
MMDGSELLKRFRHHEVTDEEKGKMADLRQIMFTTASVIDNMMPDCREKSIAIRYLEIAMFYAVSGIARNQKEDVV